MNIFVLDEDPEKAARAQCDRHVVKMILECGQMLSTVGHHHGAPGPWKPTHANHPCTRWAAEGEENYRWLWEHMGHLLDEYTVRYGKVHAFQAHHEALWQGRPRLPALGALTPFAQVMPEAYCVPGDAVTAYRRYYQAEKGAFARWRNGRIPEWFEPPTE